MSTRAATALLWRERMRDALRPGPVPPRVLWPVMVALFVLAFAVRSLYAVDVAPLLYSGHQPVTRMAGRFDESALAILKGEGVLFPVHPDPGTTGLLARPPGYPIVLAAVYRLLGRSFYAVILVQDLVNACGPPLLFLLGARIGGRATGVIAGIAAAVSAQSAFASTFVVSDSLTVVPLLAALALLAGARSKERGLRRLLPRAIAAGTLVGLTSWLRPNAMLLGVFLSLGLLAYAGWSRPVLRAALLLSVASFAVIAPITARNWIVFHEFVPISINGGITLWQGVAAAGGQGYGARTRDKLVVAEEAARFHNESYGDWWAYPDGIARDRARYRWAMDVIRAHPLWYLRAMAGRALGMLDYGAGAPLVSDAPEGVPASDPPQALGEGQPTAGPPPRFPVSTFLWPGRAAAPLRPIVRVLQRAVAAATLPLLVVGLPLLLLLDARGAGLLAAAPVHYLVLESMFILEWRVVLPMHGPIFTIAAVPLGLALGAALRVCWPPVSLRRARGVGGLPPT
jgi:hypothetical protein